MPLKQRLSLWNVCVSIIFAHTPVSIHTELLFSVSICFEGSFSSRRRHAVQPHRNLVTGYWSKLEGFQILDDTNIEEGLTLEECKQKCLEANWCKGLSYGYEWGLSQCTLSYVTKDANPELVTDQPDNGYHGTGRESTKVKGI